MHLTKGVEEARLLLSTRACSVCHRPGHRSTPAKPCTRPAIPYAAIGIEIEGYWHSHKFNGVRESARRVTGKGGETDGSLHNHDRDDPDERDRWDADDDEETNITSGNNVYRYNTEPDQWAAWEFSTNHRTAPTPTKALDQLLKLYPHGTNCRAGMHVHTSFHNSTDLALLKRPEFYANFAKSWYTWGRANLADNEEPEFWVRLSGRNKYCRLTSWPVEDVKYSQLNFVGPWNSQQTLECRLLPMFRDARKGVLAVQHLCRIYDTWITGAGLGLPAHAAELNGLLEAHADPVEVSGPLTHRADIYDSTPTSPVRMNDQEIVSNYPATPSPGYSFAMERLVRQTLPRAMPR